MKITKIELKDFHQFKDVTLDLTYPAGHAKAGQPLDKVCFIGQSGTGKTTLLELIPKFLFGYDTNLIKESDEEVLYNSKRVLHVIFGISNEYKAVINYRVDRRGDDIFWSDDKINSINAQYGELKKMFEEEWQGSQMTASVYFPSNLNYKIDSVVEKKMVISQQQFIDFSKEKISSVWNLILDSIQKYQEQGLSLRQEFSMSAEESLDDLDKLEERLQKLREWKTIEFNPIKDLADKCLNQLLKHFKLKVKNDSVLKGKDDIGFIKIEDYNSNEIPHGLWSTGTKQVILSALPLYLLKPKHTVILFDEPERSLYPDLQRIIIDFYSSLTENCQFFYSTHSPIIASSFEPWEIVELKFNQEGNIYRELYYEGENHVDNYKFDPRNMRWDDILQRIFDMADDGSPVRKKKLNQLATLHVKYKKMDKRNETDTQEAKNLLEEIAVLSKELSYWD